MNIYVFGNGNTSFSDFITHYKEPLQKYLAVADVHFTVCDFRGVDTLVMELLKSNSANVSVYHIGERPRYLPDKYRTKASQWNFVGGFEDDESRDCAAIENCTHYLAIDFNSNDKRKSGAQKNIELCESKSKIKISK